MKREDALRRRITLQSLPEVINQAERGNIDMISKFFLELLPEEEAAMLSEMMDRRFALRGPGGKANDVRDRSPAAEMERLIGAIVSSRRTRWRAANEGKPLPQGLIDSWLAEISDELGEAGELQGIEIGIANIRNNLKRGKKRKSAKLK